MFCIRHSLRCVSGRKHPVRFLSTRPIRRRKQLASHLLTQNEDANHANMKRKAQVDQMLQDTNVKNNVFVAKDKDGNDLSMDEYLKFASLSPWVPTPDAVARRCLDIAKAGIHDVHYELGSGDGRVNFQAIDVYQVKKSVGVDIDPSLIKKCNDRKRLRHPSPENLTFECVDLIDINHPKTKALWNDLRKECSILTMYFVEDALLKLKPLLETNLLERDCKVITIGYAVKGWDPKWSETVLSLTIYMYDVSNVNELFHPTSVEEIQMDQYDMDLNVLSRQQLAKMESENSDVNPFGKDAIPMPTFLDDEEEESIDFNWDFDENEEHDDVNNDDFKSYHPSAIKK